MSGKRRRVREPIQVYLTEPERQVLDELAHRQGVSRAEVLRRGLEALARDQQPTFYEAMDKLIGVLQGTDTPPDLAERHDEYLAQDIEAKRIPLRRRSS